MAVVRKLKPYLFLRSARWVLSDKTNSSSTCLLHCTLESVATTENLVTMVTNKSQSDRSTHQVFSLVYVDGRYHGEQLLDFVVESPRFVELGLQVVPYRTVFSLKRGHDPAILSKNAGDQKDKILTFQIFQILRSRQDEAEGENAASGAHVLFEVAVYLGRLCAKCIS